MGEEVLTALSPSQQVVKIVHDELIKILGQPRVEAAVRQRAAQRLHDRRPAGLGQDHHHRQAGALAVERTATGRSWSRWTSTVRRRASSLSILRASRSSCRSTRARRRDERRSTWRDRRVAKPMQTGRDVLLVDTAGRLHIDDQLMTELQQLKEQLNPVEILFVADAMTGQDAVKIGRRVPQAARHHRRHPDQDGWRCARRRGAFHPLTSPGSR